jgi:hypothetical protein
MVARSREPAVASVPVGSAFGLSAPTEVAYFRSFVKWSTPSGNTRSLPSVSGRTALTFVGSRPPETKAH